jgi:HlyD family secretion protein
MTARHHAAALLAASALAVAAGCHRDAEPDAYGTFEAAEVVVSSQAGGTLEWFRPREGERVTPGALLGIVDTTRLALERRQLLAQQGATRSRATEVTRQIAVLQAQQVIAERTYARTRRLADERAATAQQLDQAEREVRVLRAQIAATRAQRSGAGEEVAASAARLAQLDESIRRSGIRAPITGTVLATYVHAGETVQPGQPLFRVASLDTLDLRAYVSQPQLAALRLGQQVTVHVDQLGGGAAGTGTPMPSGEPARRAITGTLSWISARAEFTPTPIQTRDERAELVYAIRVRVPNPDGRLKIGMPVDVTLGAPPARVAAADRRAP